MSTIYTGVPGNVTTPLTATISGITGNTVSPIVFTTSSPHLFGNGDTVVVAGVTGNTAANGTFTITVTGANTFSVPGTGNGTASFGSATLTDISLTPQITIPSDGDVDNSASVNVALQALADRTQFLYNQYKLINIQTTSWGTGHTLTMTVGVNQIQSETVLTSSVNTLLGDVIEVALSCDGGIGSTSGITNCRYQLGTTQNGTVVGTITGSIVTIGWQGASSSVVNAPISLSGAVTITYPGSLLIWLQGNLITGSGSDNALAAYTGLSCTIKQWRAN